MKKQNSKVLKYQADTDISNISYQNLMHLIHNILYNDWVLKIVNVH